jgi:hypothetical protein
VALADVLPRLFSRSLPLILNCIVSSVPAVGSTTNYNTFRPWSGIKIQEICPTSSTHSSSLSETLPSSLPPITSASDSSLTTLLRIQCSLSLTLLHSDLNQLTYYSQYYSQRTMSALVLWHIQYSALSAHDVCQNHLVQ